MTDQPRSKIIKNNPIGKGLDAFRASFNLICEGASIPCTPDALVQLGQEGKSEQLYQGAPLTSVQMYRILHLVFYRHFKSFLSLVFCLRRQVVAPYEAIY